MRINNLYVSFVIMSKVCAGQEALKTPQETAVSVPCHVTCILEWRHYRSFQPNLRPFPPPDHVESSLVVSTFVLYEEIPLRTQQLSSETTKSDKSEPREWIRPLLEKIYGIFYDGVKWNGEREREREDGCSASPGGGRLLPALSLTWLSKSSRLISVLMVFLRNWKSIKLSRVRGPPMSSAARGCNCVSVCSNRANVDMTERRQHPTRGGGDSRADRRGVRWALVFLSDTTS